MMSPEDTERRVQSLEARVALLEKPSASDATHGSRRPMSRDERAREHLDKKDLNAAGRELRLNRAHEGREDDESYERRLHAAVDGAEAADAVHPRGPHSRSERNSAEHDGAEHEKNDAQRGGDDIFGRSSLPGESPGPANAGVDSAATSDLPELTARKRAADRASGSDMPQRPAPDTDPDATGKPVPDPDATGRPARGK